MDIKCEDATIDIKSEDATMDIDSVVEVKDASGWDDASQCSSIKVLQTRL